MKFNLMFTCFIVNKGFFETVFQDLSFLSFSNCHDGVKDAAGAGLNTNNFLSLFTDLIDIGLYFQIFWLLLSLDSMEIFCMSCTEFFVKVFKMIFFTL